MENDIRCILSFLSSHKKITKHDVSHAIETVFPPPVTPERVESVCLFYAENEKRLDPYIRHPFSSSKSLKAWAIWDAYVRYMSERFSSKEKHYHKYVIKVTRDKIIIRPDSCRIHLMKAISVEVLGELMVLRSLRLDYLQELIEDIVPPSLFSIEKTSRHQIDLRANQKGKDIVFDIVEEYNKEIQK